MSVRHGGPSTRRQIAYLAALRRSVEARKQHGFWGQCDRDCDECPDCGGTVDTCGCAPPEVCAECADALATHRADDRPLCDACGKVLPRYPHIAMVSPW